MTHNRGKRESEEVEGGQGRIVPSVRRNDRHNKVHTAKGMKDRRIRLSPNTSIQFFDVQDRLGYDQPSKAIDWLMKEAKFAIDALTASHDDHHHEEYRVPATATMFNSSGAFHQTPCDQNLNHVQTSSFNGYPLGLMNSVNRCQTERENQICVPQEINLFSPSTAPLNFNWNQNYNRGEGYDFVSREPLQSSFIRPTAHTSNNQSARDTELLGFPFQQEIQVQEAEKDNLSLSALHYRD